jgi:hypothetical protein
MIPDLPEPFAYCLVGILPCWHHPPRVEPGILQAREALARIKAAAAGRRATVATFIADLSSQASVRRLAADLLARQAG